MRWPTFLGLTVFCPAVCLAQTQERSLIDRLLRPDMELKNPAQRKTFTTSPKIVARRATVGTFSLPPSVNEKSFGPTPVVTSTEYRQREFQIDLATTSSTLKRTVNVSARTETSRALDVRETYDAHRQIAGRSFLDERSFRDEGKSQKSLNRQNPPLTIEQVRELLNKNK